MARPQKSGLDYFPLNVDMDQDDKIMLIESEFGITGFGIIVKMLCKIYSNGYFYEWGEKEQLLFSKRINVDKNEVIACINSAIKWDLFDINIYEKYHILTSKGIQKRFIEAVGRRKTLDIVEEYWLIDVPESEKMTVNLINVDINPVNVDINEKIVDINSQSKVKKSKEKKSKLNNSNSAPQNYFENEKVNTIFLEFLEVRNKLKAVNSERAINTLINKLNKYDDDTKHKMIENSIVNSWKDVYELKKQPVRQEIVPKWIDKKLNVTQPTQEEQAEMENLLKEEYKPNPELQERLRAKYGKNAK